MFMLNNLATSPVNVITAHQSRDNGNGLFVWLHDSIVREGDLESRSRRSRFIVTSVYHVRVLARQEQHII